MLINLLLGAIGGGLSAAIIARRPVSARGIPLAVLLAVIAGIYIGFGLQDQRPGHGLLQLTAALPFIVVALWRPHAVGLLGIAWIAHGLWDGAHEIGVVSTRVPAWYPAACFAWDIVVGAAAIWWARCDNRVGRA